MNRFVALLFLAVIGSGISEPSNDQPPIATKIAVISDINAYLASNPGMKLSPVIGGEKNRAGTRIKYGRRLFGDRKVVDYSDSDSWVTPEDISMGLDYPNGNEMGVVITHIDIAAQSTDEVPEVYIQEGGIGYRYVSLVIVGRKTYSLTYNLRIYGRLN